ncbi:unnamed protein product (macronuclear) [Paramecium tetraurelia]|uniref:Uncharacterized protein n=1 Tax=Paramecium tetraurelia TaxID=5888 RepID=A0CXJ4_PARTE|nr:uncharacterized protein GSPATT00011143001 [Paramecium tetraurelia]CAK75511.1 unnamed protein product [Paramecium tetraurelia]|eukprot:XP_001442908.1 hypothetical protein (macronuclear) [Paramecium tetraurelia strain d4-2]
MLKRSDIENKQVGDNQNKKDKENYLKEWEESLKRKEHLLESKHQELKIYSKNLQIQTEGLLKDKLNLGEKIEKYNRLLEQIIDQQISDQQLPKSNSQTSQTYRKPRKNGINECKERVGNLLKTIRLATKPCLKTQQGSYFSNRTEFEEILFSKRNNHSSSLTGIINLSNKEELISKQQQEQQRNSKDTKERFSQQYATQDELINHQKSLQQLEENQKYFYSKVYEELNKLKQNQ